MKKTILALTILAGAIYGAQAGLIESDDFTYNDGPIAQPTATPINASSTWFANTGSGAGKEMLVTNNTLIVAGARSEDMAHTLVGYPYETNGSTAALYSSFTLNCQVLPNQAGAYIAHFSGTNAFVNVGTPGISGFRGRVYVSSTNLIDQVGPGVGQFYIGIVNNGVNSNNVTIGNTNYVWSTPLNTNTTYTIVTRYVLATGISTLWVNPVDVNSASVTDTNIPPAEPTNAAPVNGILAIDCYSFRQAAGGGTMLIDNLKVGTIFADVAGNNQSPSISSIIDQNIPANGNTGPISFTVQDPETAASGLVVTATSGNTTLVPNGSPNIVLGGTSTNRTITITPAASQQGSAIITVNVSDTVNTSSTTFKVTVGAPSISAIPNQQAYSNTPIPLVLFTATDTENDTLTFVKTSSNPTLLPAANVVIGSSGSSSNLTITPVANQIGVATVTIQVGDGFNTNSTSFLVTISPKLGVLYNEDFAYTDFSGGLPNALYGAAGGSGAPWNHVSGPLYELQVTNGLAYIVGTNNEDLGSAFIGGAIYDGFTNGAVFYTKFTVNCSFLPSNLGDYFFHLSANGTDTTTFHDKIWANKAGAATNKFRLGVSNVGSEAQNARDLSIGATYVVVTRFDASSGKSTLWVNPTSELSDSIVATDTPASSTIGGVALRQSSGTGDLAIGPMKVGTQFSDVFTAPTAPTLNKLVDGSNIVLSWNNPLFVLQSAPAVTGPYADVAVSSPSTNAISGTQFFRLKY